MERNLKEAIMHRRSYYSLTDQSPVSDQEIRNRIGLAVKHVPSAFNSQSTRVVVLLGEHHKKLWDITKEVLREIVPAEAFPATEAKINNCFRSGHGTVLFFEDKSVVAGLQQQFPTYADRFPVWSEQTSGMHQFAIWTLLEEAGLGASLQHYNPLIDTEVAREWKINSNWVLVAQMPFGAPAQEPGEKTFLPQEDRILWFE